MKGWLEPAGNVAAILGVLLCLAAGLARGLGTPVLMGVEPMTLFIGGMGLMLAGCLAKIHCLGMRT